MSFKVVTKFHKDIWLPRIELPLEPVPLRYSNHALREARNDKYGDFSEELPDFLDLRGGDLIEVEMRGDKVIKILVRFVLDFERDVCMALAVPGWVVKTVWLNEAEDTHKTLDILKYERVA